MLLLLLILIIIVILLDRDRRLREKREFQGPDDTPLEILKRRYASGEISTDEFRKMKGELLEKNGNSNL